MTLRSDLHNFGRRVIHDGKNVWKPRSLFTEYQLLCEESPFRTWLAAHYPIKLLPNLRFKNFCSRPSLNYQCMDRLDITDIEEELTDDECQELGRLFALLNILGVRDLHKENILFGLQGKSLVFCPIDLEFIGQTNLFSAMNFLPKCENTIASSGLAWFFDYLRNFHDPDFSAKIICGYEEGLKSLFILQEDLFGHFAKEDLHSRVSIRQTSVYLKMLESKSFQGCIKEEVVQLERGDVPYFFMFLSNPGQTFYWVSETNYEGVRDFSHKDFNVSLIVKESFTTMLASFSTIALYLNQGIPLSSFRDVTVVRNRAEMVRVKIGEEIYGAYSHGK